MELQFSGRLKKVVSVSVLRISHVCESLSTERTTSFTMPCGAGGRIATGSGYSGRGHIPGRRLWAEGGVSGTGRPIQSSALDIEAFGVRGGSGV